MSEDKCECNKKCKECGKSTETPKEEEFKKVFEQPEFEPLKKYEDLINILDQQLKQFNYPQEQYSDCAHVRMDQQYRNSPIKPIHMLYCGCPRCTPYCLYTPTITA